MRRLTSWLVVLVLVLVLALPAPAFGQATTPKELVGTWVVKAPEGPKLADSLKGKLFNVLTLNADGTYTRELKKREGDSLVATTLEKTAPPSRWEAAGDTLRLGENTGYSTYAFQLKDRRLVVFDRMMWDTDRRSEKCSTVYQRFDSPEALTLPPPPKININPADLVGTWAGTLSEHQSQAKNWGTLTDSVIIGADYTLRSAHLGKIDNAFGEGTWALLPGDVLTGPLGNVNSMKLYLENGELVRCSPNYPALKRVAP